jgi:hypothetical protein
LIFLFNTAGIFALFSYLKQEHYESVLKREKKMNNLSWLSIPKSEKIHWEKKDEIIYKGNYYDIFGQKQDEENFHFLCYRDKKEIKMADALYKHLASQHSQSAGGNQGKSHTVKTILQDFVLHNFSWGIMDSAGKNLNHISFFCLTGFITVFSPPPEAA